MTKSLSGTVHLKPGAVLEILLLGLFIGSQGYTPDKTTGWTTVYVAGSLAKVDIMG